jgi:hypothetical protein
VVLRELGRNQPQPLRYQMPDALGLAARTCGRGWPGCRPPTTPRPAACWSCFWRRAKGRQPDGQAESASNPKQW